jgi:hypothetical protein
VLLLLYFYTSTCATLLHSTLALGDDVGDSGNWNAVSDTKIYTCTFRINSTFLCHTRDSSLLNFYRGIIMIMMIIRRCVEENINNCDFTSHSQQVSIKRHSAMRAREKDTSNELIPMP